MTEPGTIAALYNEIEPFAADWLVNLEQAGHIASGAVDRRDIRELKPDDVRGATQFHAFAGIGVWSHALRLAGWPDVAPVWTGSCPCQPFSIAGKRGGAEDRRHLWPEWYRLISECRPPVIFGEQVASPDGRRWLDAVSLDLETLGYAVGAADLCAAGIGAPHIRQRLFFVAISDSERLDRIDPLLRAEDTRRGEAALSEIARSAAPGNMAVANNPERRTDHAARDHCDRQNSRWPQGAGDAQGRGAVGELADAVQAEWSTRGTISKDRQTTSSGSDGRMADTKDADRGGAGEEKHPGRRAKEAGRPSTAVELGGANGERSGRNTRTVSRQETESEGEGCTTGHIPHESVSPGPTHIMGHPDIQRLARPSRQSGDNGQEQSSFERTGGATRGFWADTEWIPCRDGKWRPVEPGTFPLAHGAPGRMGRLRAYGNAIVAPVAATFIRATMELIR